MATLPETGTWADGIRQIENGEAAEGGADGLANQQAKELANRTSWLRTKVEAIQQSQPFEFMSFPLVDDGGRTSWMVWVPQVTIGAGSLGGWPTADLTVGGFYVDQYLCSHADAPPWGADYDADALNISGLDTGDVGVSRPMVRPWTSATQTIARAALAARVYGDSSSPTLLTLRQWAEVALIIRWLAVSPRGNNHAGRDSRDADLPQNYGAPSPLAGQTLTGSGPSSWHVTGKRSGIADWWGNAKIHVQFAPTHGHLTTGLNAVLADPGGIDDTQVSLTLSGLELPEMWPASGELWFEFEHLTYATMADNGDGTYTFGGLTRGMPLYAADSHAQGEAVSMVFHHCILPYGGTWLVSGSGLDNDTDSSSTFQLDELILGPHAAAVAVGDLILVGSEQIVVTAVSGSDITGTRGANGSTKAAHADGARGCHVSQTAPVNIAQVSGYPQVNGFMAGPPREDSILMRYLLPDATQKSRPDDDAEWGDWFAISMGPGEYSRGGSHVDGHYFSPRGEALEGPGVSITSQSVAFRGALVPS